MATKGAKNGTAKPVARKPVRVAKPVLGTEPAAKAGTPETVVPPATVIEPTPEVVPAIAEVSAPIDPVPALEAAPQEAIEAPLAVDAATEPQAVVEAVVTDNRKVETMIEANTQKAQAMFAEFNDRTKAAVEKSTKLVEEANDFAKGNVEAIVESGKIAAKGLETLGQDAAEYGRKSFETTTAALKTFASVKSPTELFKLQSDFFRTAFDSYVAEASKNTEALIKLAGDAAQPISSRFAIAAEKVKAAA